VGSIPTVSTKIFHPRQHGFALAGHHLERLTRELNQCHGRECSRSDVGIYAPKVILGELSSSSKLTGSIERR
jgi:hypothetical protein